MWNTDTPWAWDETHRMPRPASDLFIEDQVTFGYWEVSKRMERAVADADRFELMDNHFPYDL